MKLTEQDERIQDLDSRRTAVFAVSDASGGTAERIVRSALVQFKDSDTEVIVRGQVDSAARVTAVVREAAERHALIVHTLVSSAIRSLMREECEHYHVGAVDLMGPVLDHLAALLKLSPLQQPGLLKAFVDARAKEVEAVEFAFRHDDGQHPEELDRAEIVLLGISRTMKTPTTLYLAYRGWLAANVPLVANTPLPPELFRIPPERVFCLDMSASRLVDLRRVRAEALKIPAEPYASLEQVRWELTQARQLCSEHGWKRVDVTGKSVEEATREILTLLSASDRADRQ